MFEVVVLTMVGSFATVWANRKHHKQMALYWNVGLRTPLAT